MKDRVGSFVRMKGSSRRSFESIPEDIRIQCYALREQGMGMRRIGKQLGIPESAVRFLVLERQAKMNEAATKRGPQAAWAVHIANMKGKNSPVPLDQTTSSGSKESTDEVTSLPPQRKDTSKRSKRETSSTTEHLQALETDALKDAEDEDSDIPALTPLASHPSTPVASKKNKRSGGLPTADEEASLQAVYEKCRDHIELIRAVNSCIAKDPSKLLERMLSNDLGADAVVNLGDPVMLVDTFERSRPSDQKREVELRRQCELLVLRMKATISLLQSARVLLMSNERGVAYGDLCYQDTALVRWKCEVCGSMVHYSQKASHQSSCFKKCAMRLNLSQKAAIDSIVKGIEKQHPWRDEIAESAQQWSVYTQPLVRVSEVLYELVLRHPRVICLSEKAWESFLCSPQPVIPALALLALALEGRQANSELASKIMNVEQRLNKLIDRVQVKCGPVADDCNAAMGRLTAKRAPLS